MEYEFKYLNIPTLDWCLYEITRHPGEIPFTVLVRNFSKLGHRQFFSDIFVAKAWDRGRSEIASYDIKICFELWDYFGLKQEYGPFSPFYINKPPSIHHEPKVYRRTLREVLMNKLSVI